LLLLFSFSFQILKSPSFTFRSFLILPVSTYERKHRYLSFWVCLISSNIVVYNSFHFPVSSIISLCLNKTPLCIYIYNIFIISLSFSVHLGWFPNLIILNSTVINMGMQYFYGKLTLSDVYPAVVWLHHMVVLFLVLLRNFHTDFHSDWTKEYFHPAVNESSYIPPTHILTNICCLLFS
jgi:hypothetical protein